jgi:anti-sigma factor RsiW
MLCGRATNLISAYIDRELTGADMLQVREHLQGCGACRQEFEDLARMKALLGGMPAVAPRHDYVAATMLRLHIAQGRAPVERRFRWPEWWRGMTGYRLRVATLATGLIVALVATGWALHQPGHPDATAFVVAQLQKQSDSDEWRVPRAAAGRLVIPVALEDRAEATRWRVDRWEAGWQTASETYAPPTETHRPTIQQIVQSEMPGLSGAGY